MEIRTISSSPFDSHHPYLAIEDLNKQLSFIDNIDSFSDTKFYNYFENKKDGTNPNKVIAYITIKINNNGK